MSAKYAAASMAVMKRTITTMLKIVKNVIAVLLHVSRPVAALFFAVFAAWERAVVTVRPRCAAFAVGRSNQNNGQRDDGNRAE